MRRTTFLTQELGKYKCKNCGEEFEIDGLLTGWHYCPSCGSEIESWQEE